MNVVHETVLAREGDSITDTSADEDMPMPMKALECGFQL
jgi:hypothetical protein